MRKGTYLKCNKVKLIIKKDGFAQVKYELVAEHKLTPFATMIDIKL